MEVEKADKAGEFGEEGSWLQKEFADLEAEDITHATQASMKSR